MKRLTTSQIAQTALLAALTLVLSYLETLIPLPVTVPGIKLGIANITVLFALYLLDVPTAIFLMLVKVVIASLLFGSPLMIVYSLCGSVLAFIGMYALKKTGKVSIVVVSIVAAVLHNIGQLIAATFMLQTPAVLVNAPVLIIAACITGSITGAIAFAVIKAVKPSLKHQKKGVILEEPRPAGDKPVVQAAQPEEATTTSEPEAEADATAPESGTEASATKPSR